MKLLFLLTIIIVVFTSMPAYSSGDHSIDKHDEPEAKDSLSLIDASMAQQLGIVTSTASTQQLEQSVVLFGSLISNPEQISHVRARFEGLIKSVAVTIGDEVKTGALLAEIESNDSLKVYKIRAPISGRVVQRHANTGEFTQDQVLFSIANLDTLWAELRVFPTQQSSVRKGQPVHIFNGKDRIDSKVNHVVPSLDTPHQLARIKLDNTDQTLTPGLMVQGQAVTDQFSAELAVDVNAIQALEDRNGVFVREGDTYSFTPLVLGRRDNYFVEVLSGLNQGDEYVSQNSYLLKADLEKSEAEHDH